MLTHLPPAAVDHLLDRATAYLDALDPRRGSVDLADAASRSVTTARIRPAASRHLSPWVREAVGFLRDPLHAFVAAALAGWAFAFVASLGGAW